jgi:hypothetical protein
MNHEEAWKELYERLTKARDTLVGMIDDKDINRANENIRLRTKLGGIRSAISYMEDIQKEIVAD